MLIFWRYFSAAEIFLHLNEWRWSSCLITAVARMSMKLFLLLMLCFTRPCHGPILLWRQDSPSAAAESYKLSLASVSISRRLAVEARPTWWWYGSVAMPQLLPIVHTTTATILLWNQKDSSYCVIETIITTVDNLLDFLYDNFMLNSTVMIVGVDVSNW